MLSYTHFTLDERKYLQELLEKGYSFRKIASFLGRSPSTVSREVMRNKAKNKPAKPTNCFWYNSWRATIVSNARRKQNRRLAFPDGSPLTDYIIDKLKQFWSPEQIAARWKLEHPGDTVCFSTIYRYIRKRVFPDITASKNLRRKGKSRHFPNRSVCNTIHPDHLIPDWPQEIVQRIRIGDWEGDTVYGGIGKGLLVTLVDRNSRFLCAGLLTNRDSTKTREAISQLLHGLPVKSVSLDNGSEFSEFRMLEKELGAPVYFAEPHKPW